MNTESYLLVTGATGGLGRNLTEHLLNANYSVIATGRNQAVGNELQAKGAIFIPHNLHNPINIDKSFGTCEGIIHCAALSKPWGKYIDFYNTNIQGTEHVVNFAMVNNTPLVHISTPSVYFNYRDQLNIGEEQTLPKRFSSYYTDTKKRAEDIVLAAYRKGLPAVILRPRGIFGPYDTGIIPRILRIATRGFFPLIKQGNAVIDVTYVDNVVLAIMLALNKLPEISGSVINITNNQPLRVKDILVALFNTLNIKVKFINSSYAILKTLAITAETVSRLVNYKFEPLITQYTLGLLAYSQTLNIHKAQSLLNYNPSISITKGISKYSDWYKLCLSN